MFDEQFLFLNQNFGLNPNSIRIAKVLFSAEISRKSPILSAKVLLSAEKVLKSTQFLKNSLNFNSEKSRIPCNFKSV